MILSVHQSSWCCWGAIDLWVAHSRIALVRVCGSFVTQVSSPCSFNSPLKPGMLACVRGACQGSSTHTHTHTQRRQSPTQQHTQINTSVSPVSGFLFISLFAPRWFGLCLYLRRIASHLNRTERNRNEAILWASPASPSSPGPSPPPVSHFYSQQLISFDIRGFQSVLNNAWAHSVWVSRWDWTELSGLRRGRK